jgi:hypothetical protein
MKLTSDNFTLLSNKIWRKIFVPLGITRMPKSKQSVISDLFFIRADKGWETSFELLNINALLLGSFEHQEWHSAKMYFFGSDGEVIKELQIPMDSTPRFTLRINDIIQDFPKVPATFALFHSEGESAEFRGQSLIAERGYVGYEFKGLGVRGYVHGNLDAVALSNNAVEPIGNSGIFKRDYTVQHLLIGVARYEFAFTNPTSKSQRISMEVSDEPNKWVKYSEQILKPLGSGIFEIEDFGKPSVVRFKSKLYLGRPIVFRITPNSLDVFHG